MKIRKSVFFLGLVFVPLISIAQAGFGDAHKINRDWKFALQDDSSSKEIKFNDSKWGLVNLPHDWSIRQPFSPTYPSCTGYLPGGIGWYRKNFRLPEEKKGNKIFLYFEGIYNRSEVYLNGKLLGKRPNGYISVMYDATPYVKYGEDNIIAVRVDHSKFADSRWYPGSGIYRDVWLVYSDPIHISQWGVYAYPTNVSAKKGMLHLETEIINESEKEEQLTVVNELFNNMGEIVASQRNKILVEAKKNAVAQTSLSVSKPQLWSVNNPYLYVLKTTILKDGKEIDSSKINTGFRTFSFDANKGFALNGERMKMKGVCIHHDAGVLGAASYQDVWKRRLQKLKELGVNAIRTSHNPQAPHLYELCDELGILVLDEAFDEWKYPKRKWLQGWNKGNPAFNGSYDFFEEWGEKDLADMIRRDRNHVSIFAWSIGNEVDYPNDPYSHPILDGGTNTGFTQPIFGGYKKDAPNAEELGIIAKRLVDVVKKYDTSRPATAALAGVAMSNATQYPFVLDIAGYNYSESRYDTDHKQYPERIIFGSENRHEFKEWKAVRDKDFIFGQFLWTGIDYLGESGVWPSRGFYSGLLDLAGNIKPRGRFRQSLWSEKPFIYIGTYPAPNAGAKSALKDVWSQTQSNSKKKEKKEKPSMDAWPVWNYENGESVRVVCYTNAASVQLLLNDKPIEDRKNFDDETGIIMWDIPYVNGKLEAIGYDLSGKEIGRDIIRSSKRPYALAVENENPVINKNDGIAHVMVRIVDENNLPVILADNQITCKIQGPATLLGMEAGNNEDMTDYTDNTHRAFNGCILVYVQSIGKGGKVKLTFSSPLLKSAETSIEIN
jgi:hypothetical protein